MELGLTTLLRLAWVAATLPIVLASLPLPGLGFFHRILSGFAARGKTVPPSSRKFTVPQRFFLHFYVVAVALTTSLLLSMWFYAYRKMLPLATESLNYSMVASHLTGGSHVFSVYKSKSTSMDHRFGAWRTVFVLLLMEVQVLRRLYETLNVFTYSPSACMHIFGYIAGIFTYLPEAVTYACSQVAEFIVKGRDRMPAPEFNLLEYVKPLISLGWCQWIGAAIYIWGWLHQLSCHAILGSLRGQKGADEYVIPRGDWFEYVSCPHYLAEIVIYTGIVLASGGLDITIWLLFFFVVSNLVFAAAETHRWYQHKFDIYPQSRHAIFPLIY